MKVPINQYLHQLGLQFKATKASQVVFLSIGNPGTKYHETRHSAGHMVCQKVIDNLGGLTAVRDRGNVTIGQLHMCERVHFAESTAFMNESGHAFQGVLKTLYGEHTDIIVVHDDTSLEVGDVKFKMPSQAFGGHNGLRDIVQFGAFARLRIGIGRPPSMDSASVSKYVLSKFTVVQRNELEKQAVPKAQHIVHDIMQVFAK